MREIINVQQGSPEWLELRQRHLCASEAPAMLGYSKFMKRNQLMFEKITGKRAEVSEYTQRLFDRGHEAEFEARPVAEVEAECALFPIVVVRGNLLASLDGQSMDGTIIWEHKLFNQALIDYIKEHEDLPETHWPQVEHQLYVSGAQRCLFSVSDGTPFGIHHFWYKSRLDRLDAVLEGWQKFAEEMVKTNPEDLLTVERDDEEWHLLSAELHFHANQIDHHTEKAKTLKEKLLKLAGKRRTTGNGVLIYSTTRNTVDHKQLIKDHNIDTTPYTKTSTSWSVKLNKAKGAA